MKKIKSTALLTLLFAAFSLTSCTKEDLPEENLPSKSYGTSTGNYWPMAVGNIWNNTVDGSTVSATEITGTDVFGGSTYYKLSSPLSGSDAEILEGFDMQLWIAKKGAAYFSKVGDFNYSQDGMTIKMKGYEMTLLKDNLAVGESWSGTFPMDMTYSFDGESETLKMSTKYTGTILEKNVEVTVNGVSYPDVIKVEMKQELSIKDPETGETETTTVNQENWYAKGVGPIKTISSNDEKTSESYLKDYIIK